MHDDDEEIHRGLRNLAGQNNCFLNSALQTLWHLPKFRQALTELPSASAEIYPNQLSLLPSLQSLFASYQYGDDAVLPADEVRAVLGALYATMGKFQMGEIDDAVECLEAILATIHCEAVGVPLKEGGDDLVCSPPCPACAVFKVAYFDMASCSSCRATADPTMHSDFVYRVWVADLLLQNDQNDQTQAPTPTDGGGGLTGGLAGGGRVGGKRSESFAEGLRRTWQREALEELTRKSGVEKKEEEEEEEEKGGEGRGSSSGSNRKDRSRTNKAATAVRRPAGAPPAGAGKKPGERAAKVFPVPEAEAAQGLRCPGLVKCVKGHAVPQRWCVSEPGVLTASLVWASTQASGHEIGLVLDRLGANLDLATVFTLTPPPPAAPSTSARGGSGGGTRGSSFAAAAPTPRERGRGGGGSNWAGDAVSKTLAQGSEYRFCGMICYYGLHYVSMFARRVTQPAALHSASLLPPEGGGRRRRGEWLVFDDAHIRVLPSWRDAKEFCVRSKYQPTVVWFEKLLSWSRGAVSTTPFFAPSLMRGTGSQVPPGEAPWWDEEDDADGEPGGGGAAGLASKAMSTMGQLGSALRGIATGVGDGVKEALGTNPTVATAAAPSSSSSSSASSVPQWSLHQAQAPHGGGLGGGRGSAGAAAGDGDDPRLARETWHTEEASAKKRSASASKLSGESGRGGGCASSKAHATEASTRTATVSSSSSSFDEAVEVRRARVATRRNWCDSVATPGYVAPCPSAPPLDPDSRAGSCNHSGDSTKKISSEEKNSGGEEKKGARDYKDGGGDEDDEEEGGDLIFPVMNSNGDGLAPALAVSSSPQESLSSTSSTGDRNRRASRTGLHLRSRLGFGSDSSQEVVLPLARAAAASAPASSPPPPSILFGYSVVLHYHGLKYAAAAAASKTASSLVAAPVTSSAALSGLLLAVGPHRGKRSHAEGDIVTKGFVRGAHLEEGVLVLPPEGSCDISIGDTLVAVCGQRVAGMGLARVEFELEGCVRIALLDPARPVELEFKSSL